MSLRCSVFCLIIILSYLPQYASISWASSSDGISTRYILFHTLFSFSALAQRIGGGHHFWEAFNCVNGGHLRGWQAFSALLGFIQVTVQWHCAVLL